MIPDAAYGSVISGSFTLILLVCLPQALQAYLEILNKFRCYCKAVEKQEKMRMDIQMALADIPRKLDSVQRLSELHGESLELCRCADRVFSSVFIVLERIIDRLTMGFKGSFPHT